MKSMDGEICVSMHADFESAMLNEGLLVFSNGVINTPLMAYAVF